MDTLNISTTGQIVPEESNESIALDEPTKSNVPDESTKSNVPDESTKSIEELMKEVSDSQDEQDQEDSKVDGLSIVEVSKYER